jgi:fructose-bisphosphate aldolase class II
LGEPPFELKALAGRFLRPSGLLKKRCFPGAIALCAGKRAKPLPNVLIIPKMDGKINNNCAIWSAARSEAADAAAFRAGHSRLTRVKEGLIQMLQAQQAIARALERRTVIPAFNIPYLPMVKPVVQAVVDANSVAMVQVARVEWEKFSSVSLEAVAEEYAKYKNDRHTLLHLDHTPVIDEDMKRVDYMPIIERALKSGYQSVMVDASRLEFALNLQATKAVCEAAHAAGVPCESELGAVMGHESGPMMPYEEIFASKKGFTDIEEARRFASESGCDWLSVAVGNIHGAVAESTRHQKKPQARLDVEHIAKLQQATGLPLVLHGGSGIQKEYILAGIRAGIAKINVGTEIRQAYEQALAKNPGDIPAARQAVYERTSYVISDMLEIKNSRTLIFG